jgi:hypothetical protein
MGTGDRALFYESAMPSKKSKTPAEPRLGIFWFVKGKLLIDSSWLAESEPYGDHLNHPRNHIDVWRTYRRNGVVPPECVYEEYPRGRVMHHAASGEFTVLADKCILGRQPLIAEIKKALHLPKETKIGHDPHYKCFECLHGKEQG